MMGHFLLLLLSYGNCWSGGALVQYNYDNQIWGSDVVYEHIHWTLLCFQEL